MGSPAVTLDLSKAQPLPQAPVQLDLSKAVPLPQANAPVEKSLWQKAKDNFNAATQGAKPGDGAIKSFVEDVGAGGGDVNLRHRHRR